jgi:hypothetical protein
MYIKEYVELVNEGIEIMISKIKKYWTEFKQMGFKGLALDLLESLPRIIWYFGWFVIGYVVGAW